SRTGERTDAFRPDQVARFPQGLPTRYAGLTPSPALTLILGSTSLTLMSRRKEVAYCAVAPVVCRSLSTPGIRHGPLPPGSRAFDSLSLRSTSVASHATFPPGCCLSGF